MGFNSAFKGLMTETHVLKKVCFMCLMWQKECVSRNTCAKDSVFCETDTCAKENMFLKRHTNLRKCFMTDTYTKENIIHGICAMRQGHMCQRQCFMRQTCAKANVS